MDIWSSRYIDKYLSIVYAVFRGSNVSERSYVCIYGYIDIWIQCGNCHGGSRVWPRRNRWCLWLCPLSPGTYRRCTSSPLPDLCWRCRLSLVVQLGGDVVLMPTIRMLFRKNAICCGRKPALVLLSTVPWSWFCCWWSTVSAPCVNITWDYFCLPGLVLLVPSPVLHLAVPFLPEHG